MHARLFRLCLVALAFAGSLMVSVVPGISKGSETGLHSGRPRVPSVPAVIVPARVPKKPRDVVNFAGITPRRAIAIRKRISRYGLAWPHVNMLTSRWGVRRSGFHHGIDILCARSGGEYIYAANDGWVVLAGTIPIYGRAVILQHPNGLKTLYAHLSRITVVRGRWVNRGNVVGRCGSTGRSTNPHLHFEVYVNGLVVDPLPKLPSWGAPA